jgi:hypothetical protein
MAAAPRKSREGRDLEAIGLEDVIRNPARPQAVHAPLERIPVEEAAVGPLPDQLAQDDDRRPRPPCLNQAPIECRPRLCRHE